MIWKHLGFNRDIFFIEPLHPNSEDMELFVGREEDSQKYLIDSLSSARALKIVTGEVGVGKTTFVNACQYFSYKQYTPWTFPFQLPSILPCFEKIQLRETDNIEVIIQNTITSLCQSIVKHCKTTGQEPPKVVKDILSYFLDLFTSSSGGYNLGISILGTGAEFGKNQGNKTPNILRNARERLVELVDIVRNDFKLDGVFIFVNNTEILSKSKLIHFFNEARDELLDINGIYWTFIGGKGLGSVIETEAKRVADYLSGTELYLSPLSYNDTQQIINVRVENFREKDNVRCPITDDTVATIHNLSLKEARETLRICGEIVKRVITLNPSLSIIPWNHAMAAFIQYANEKSRDIHLSDANKKLLKAIFLKDSCRPKDYAEYGYKSSQAFNMALKSLISKRMLSVELKEGRARIYKMTGMTMLAAITGALGEEIQKTAEQKIKRMEHGSFDEEYDESHTDQLDLELD